MAPEQDQYVFTAAPPEDGFQSFPYHCSTDYRHHDRHTCEYTFTSCQTITRDQVDAQDEFLNVFDISDHGHEAHDDAEHLRAWTAHRSDR